jgi:hypothetical protein
VLSLTSFVAGEKKRWEGIWRERRKVEKESVDAMRGPKKQGKGLCVAILAEFPGSKPVSFTSPNMVIYKSKKLPFRLTT